MLLIWFCCIRADEYRTSDSMDNDRVSHDGKIPGRDRYTKAFHSEVARYGPTYDGRTRRELGNYVGNTMQGLSTGLRFIIKCISATARTVGNFSRFAVSRAANSAWFRKSTQLVKLIQNKTARESTLASTKDLAISIYSKTPEILNSVGVILDSTAQYSLEVSRLDQNFQSNRLICFLCSEP